MTRKIIVCDDDRDILEMIDIILRDENTEVISVLNSLTLFAEMEKHKPDLLLVDLWMPVLTGDQIIRQLRRNNDFANFPIVVMSASRDGKDIAIDAGANAYIEKPFQLQDLIGTIDRYTYGEKR